MLILVELAGRRVYVYREWDRHWSPQCGESISETLSVVWADGDLPDFILSCDLGRAVDWITWQTGAPLSPDRLVKAIDAYRLTIVDYAALGFVLTEEACREWFSTWPACVPVEYWQVCAQTDEVNAKCVQNALFV